MDFSKHCANTVAANVGFLARILITLFRGRGVLKAVFICAAKRALPAAEVSGKDLA